MKGLKDKIVLVTGGAKGLGKAMTTRFLQEGATVVIADVDAEASAATVEELGTLGPIEAYQIDLRDADAIEAMVDYVAEKYGRIDIAVNNAGVQIHGWATEFPLEKFDMMLSLNLRAYYLVARAAARYMKKQGGGSIVCISSGNSSAIPPAAPPITSPRPASTAWWELWRWSGAASISASTAWRRALWIRSCSGSASKTASSMWTTICWWFP